MQNVGARERSDWRISSGSIEEDMVVKREKEREKKKREIKKEKVRDRKREREDTQIERD